MTERRWPRPLLAALVLLCASAPGAASASTDDASTAADVAAIRLGVDAQAPIWRGQQVTLQLDLLTSGQRFGDQRFSLPEVAGGFLLRSDSSTIRLSERRGGANWQVLRYPITFFPQRAGDLVIPPFDVEFSVAEAFGSPPRAFRFRTEPLVITVRSPPGVPDGTLVVTTSDYQVEAAWDRRAGDGPEGEIVARPGDALTLRVTQRAAGLSGMVLPVLPLREFDGLAAYAATPVIEDRSVRGRLRGERTDSITWMVERPGRYELPEIRYRWFDPEGGVLHSEVVPGLRLRVPEGPTTPEAAVGTAPAATPATAPGLLLLGAVLAALLVLTAVAWPQPVQRFRLWLEAQLDARLAGRDPNEALAFASARRACRGRDAAAAYGALNGWLRAASAGDAHRPRSLLDLAADDAVLEAELTALQSALLARPRRSWSGERLLRVLPRLRARGVGAPAASLREALAPLNPERG